MRRNVLIGLFILVAMMLVGVGCSKKEELAVPPGVPTPDPAAAKSTAPAKPGDNVYDSPPWMKK